MYLNGHPERSEGSHKDSSGFTLRMTCDFLSLRANAVCVVIALLVKFDGFAIAGG